MSSHFTMGTMKAFVNRSVYLTEEDKAELCKAFDFLEVAIARDMTNEYARVKSILDIQKTKVREQFIDAKADFEKTWGRKAGQIRDTLTASGVKVTDSVLQYRLDSDEELAALKVKHKHLENLYDLIAGIGFNINSDMIVQDSVREREENNKNSEVRK